MKGLIWLRNAFDLIELRIIANRVLFKFKMDLHKWCYQQSWGFFPGDEYEVKESRAGRKVLYFVVCFWGHVIYGVWRECQLHEEMLDVLQITSISQSPYLDTEL